ncbi:DUF3488 and DUF4129 domain-containing transglutaminase family protein [Paenibacillus chartarius]|uniref:DUF3488 and DUF4129 domain-containing transglutaminase family protein n=1 Tax=Paenibacillus chartarius TaxID=747481 RepID=A0ABV6DT67_9BACL
MADRIRSSLASSFNWFGRAVHIALVGLFLLQYVLWAGKEEAMWWPETVVHVEWTLAVTAFVLMIPKLSWRWRTVLMIATFFVHNALLTNLAISQLPDSFAAFGSWLGYLLAQMTPYVWFSFGACIVYVFANWYAKQKRNIYVWMIATILFFCIRDSFSTLVLWPQVAMVLFCGLMLLILRHFAEFQRKAPKSWEHIAQYPSAVLMPIVMMMAAVVLLGVYTPTIQPLLTDPYTAWKHAKGEAVLLASKGEISDWVAPAQDTSSGYGRNDRDLGGGFRFDYTPVFTVDTTEKSYWRGETRSVYNGSGWELANSERRASVTNARVGSALRPESRIDTSLVQTKEVVQTFKFYDGQSFPVLFAAKTAQQLQEINGGAEPAPVLWASEQSELRFRGERTTYPKQYTVVSQVPIVDEKQLKQVVIDSSLRAALPEYFQLPQGLPQRVRTLAEQVTQDAATPYEKVKKLEQYLNMNFKYTNTPDESKGRSEDFVDRFLFELKEGYCDYYSSAMVVMTRSLGIPARWVKGYSSGTTSLQDEISQGLLGNILPSMIDDSGTYTVRNSDAHSWAEVYFPGYGWIPFEPTSGFAMPLIQPEVVSEPLPEIEPEPVVPAPAAEQEQTGTPVLALSISGGITAVLAALAAVLWRTGWLKRQLRRKKPEPVDFSQRVVIEFERLLRYCKRKGYRRQEHETLRESFARWMAKSRWIADDLEVLLGLFERAKYGKGTVGEEDYQLAVRTMQHLRMQLK